MFAYEIKKRKNKYVFVKVAWEYLKKTDYCFYNFIFCIHNMRQVQAQKTSNWIVIYYRKSHVYLCTNRLGSGQFHTLTNENNEQN
jgi:hypothetical protein